MDNLIIIFSIKILQEWLHDSGKDDKSRAFSTLDKEKSSPNKKARKSLTAAVNWSSHQSTSNTSTLQPQQHHQSLCRVSAAETSLTNPETPSKSLLGTDTSLLFSPPSILKDTLGGTTAGSSSGSETGSRNGSEEKRQYSGSGVDTDESGRRRRELSGSSTGGDGSNGGGNGSPPKSKVIMINDI